MYEDYKKYFSDRLYFLRDSMNVSARKMSKDLNLNEGYINSLENGKTLPRMEHFFMICEYLGVTPSEFFINFSKDNANLPEAGEFSGLSPELKNYLHHMVQKELAKIKHPHRKA